MADSRGWGGGMFGHVSMRLVPWGKLVDARNTKRSFTSICILINRLTAVYERDVHVRNEPISQSHIHRHTTIRSNKYSAFCKLLKVLQVYGQWQWW